VQWFEALDQTKYVPYLVYFMGVIVGFCAVAYVDGTPWLTAGLHESVRGKGLGRKTFQAMIDLCKTQGYKTIMLDVLLTNPRAMLLYYDLGFRIVDVTERVAVMKLELE
jgi:L-amino acid N-acyltransferase YncA